MERNSKIIQLIIAAKNAFTPEAKKVGVDLTQLEKQYQSLDNSIKAQGGRVQLINDFKRLSPIVQENKDELVKYTASLAAQTAEIKKNGTATTQQLATLQRTKITIADLRAERRKTINELASVTKALRLAGIAENDLDNQLKKANLSIIKQRQELAKLGTSIVTSGAQATKFAADTKSLNSRFKTGIISLNRYRSALVSIGVAFTALAGVGRVANLFGDLDQEMTAVQKVTSLTTNEVFDLTGNLEHLSNEISASTTPELLKMAEAAGRLGIDGKDTILEFVTVMDQLTVSTNLAGEAGADSFGRLINSLGTPKEKFAELASSLVAVGNNVASNEALIARFAARISNATKEADFADDVVIALAGSMAELGINAESGGTQIGRVTRELRAFAADGGTEAVQVAELMNISLEELKRLGEDAPDELLIGFLKGLDGLSTGAGEATEKLVELGLSNERILQTIPPLALGFNKLEENLQKSNEAYEKGVALSDEAIRAYAQQNSILARTANAARTAGEAFGAAFSDSYIAFLQSLNLGGEESVKTFQSLGNSVGGALEQMTNFFSVTKSFSDLIGLTTVLKGTVASISIAFGGLEVAMLSVNEIILKIRIGFNKFQGDGEKVAELQEQLVLNNERFEKTFDGFAQIDAKLKGTTQGYFDLVRAVEDNADAIEHLDAVDKLALKTILESTDAIKDNDLEYTRLTNAIGKNAEILRIQDEQQKVANSTFGDTAKRLDDLGASTEDLTALLLDEVDRTFDLIDSKNKLASAVASVSENYKEGVRPVEQLTAVLENNYLTGDQLIETVEELLAARVLEKDGVDALAVANGRLVDTVEDIIGAKEELVEATVNGVKGDKEAREALADLNEQLAANQKLWDENKITHEQFTSVQTILERGIDDLSETLKREVVEVDKSVKAKKESVASTTSLVGANTELKTSLDSTTTSIEDNSRSIKDSEANVRAAKVELRQLNTDLSINRLELDNGTISQSQFAKNQKEIEKESLELSKTIRDGNDAISALEATQRSLNSAKEETIEVIKLEEQAHESLAETSARVSKELQANAAASVAATAAATVAANKATSDSYDALIESQQNSDNNFSVSLAGSFDEDGNYSSTAEQEAYAEQDALFQAKLADLERIKEENLASTEAETEAQLERRAAELEAVAAASLATMTAYNDKFREEYLDGLEDRGYVAVGVSTDQSLNAQATQTQGLVIDPLYEDKYDRFTGNSVEEEAVSSGIRVTFEINTPTSEENEEFEIDVVDEASAKGLLLLSESLSKVGL